MIELTTTKQLAKATLKAKSSNLFVQATSVFRQYRVTNRETGAQYTVNFFVRADRKKFGHCTCLAGQNNMACKHLSAAAGLHVCIAQNRQAA
jgi:hypothetical protein